MFDPNGILLDIGSGLLRIIDEHSRSVPHHWKAMAAQRMRPSSSDISEDSSISTEVSMTKSKPEHVILGGLLQPPSGGLGANNPGIYPSSASEFDDEEDENAYRKSGEARVCKISNAGNAPTKEKAAESPPVAGVNAHRLPFQCTASLKIHFSKRLVDRKDSSTIMDHWESPLEHLQAKPSAPAQSPQRKSSRDTTHEQSCKRKDSFASQATPSPARQLRHQHGDADEFSSCMVQQFERTRTSSHKKLESTVTGATKRESKHKA